MIIGILAVGLVVFAIAFASYIFVGHLYSGDYDYSKVPYALAPLVMILMCSYIAVVTVYLLVIKGVL